MGCNISCHGIVSLSEDMTWQCLEILMRRWSQSDTLALHPQGYLFISVLVSANSELIKLIIQSIKNDLSSRNPINVCLALQCIANIGNEEMVDAVGKEVPKLLVSPDTNDSVKQCAALCVLKLFRLKTDILPPGEWTSRIVQLLNDKHLVSSAMQLFTLSFNCVNLFWMCTAFLMHGQLSRFNYMLHSFWSTSIFKW